MGNMPHRDTVARVFRRTKGLLWQALLLEAKREVRRGDFGAAVEILRDASELLDDRASSAWQQTSRRIQQSRPRAIEGDEEVVATMLETLVLALREHNMAAIRGCMTILEENSIDVSDVLLEAARRANEGGWEANQGNELL